VDYKILEPAGLRSRYVTLTDSLIHRLEGHDGWVPHYVVCLDKSGRPVAWLVRALWPVLARTPGTDFADAVIPSMPAFRFVNIDREQWWAFTGGSEFGVIDVSKVPADSIAKLRRVFLPRTEPPTAWLDDKRVLVVDEVKNTGDTLQIARGLFERAFPTADVRIAHWMDPGNFTDPSGMRRTSDVPVWYRADTWQGRLVGNRLDSANPRTTRRNVEASLFLSTRPVVPDQRGRRLRLEAAQLAADVAAGELLARPCSDRDNDDWDRRIKVLYGFTDPRAFTSARKEQDARE
jgi:hypothetical protein